MKLRAPYGIQTNCWSAVMKQRGIVAISRTNTGKTLAYVAPLLARMFSDTSIREVYRSNPGDMRKISPRRSSASEAVKSVTPHIVVLCSTRKSIEVSQPLMMRPVCAAHNFELFK